MIRTRKDLREYLDQDKRQLAISRKHPRPFLDNIWKYEICLRRFEYWLNQPSGLVSRIMCGFYKFRYIRSSIKLGISIAPNTCGKGLSIAHQNCIQVNYNAHIGENLRIHEGVTIGSSGGTEAPTIGNNVFLGSGCKIIGDIAIADDVAVGAGAVVVKSVEESGISIGGNPAKKISNHNSHKLVFWFNDGREI